MGNPTQGTVPLPGQSPTGGARQLLPSGLVRNAPNIAPMTNTSGRAPWLANAGGYLPPQPAAGAGSGYVPPPPGTYLPPGGGYTPPPPGSYTPPPTTGGGGSYTPPPPITGGESGGGGTTTPDPGTPWYQEEIDQNLEAQNEAIRQQEAAAELLRQQQAAEAAAAAAAAEQSPLGPVPPGMYFDSDSWSFRYIGDYGGGGGD